MSAGQPLGLSDRDHAIRPDVLNPEPPSVTPTYDVLLVLQFNISPTFFSKPGKDGKQLPGGQGRAEAEGEIREGYTRLIKTLKDANLKITTRQSINGDEVWVMIGAEKRRIAQLAARERREDFIHGLVTTTRADPFDQDIPPGEKIRFVYELLTTNTLQGGLGITPKKGDWKRVQSIMALHDDRANHTWLHTWLTKRWYVGFINPNEESNHAILQTHGPSVALYFSFLSFYSMSLIPLSVIGTIFFLGSQGVFAKIATWIGLETWAYTGGVAESGYGWSWSWIYAGCVGIWGVLVTELWRVKERKFSVEYGTYKVNSVPRLRPEYLVTLPGTFGHAAPATTATNAIQASHNPQEDPTLVSREVRKFASVPVILALGSGLALVLTGIFVFEQFLAKLYSGFGARGVGLIPTLAFTFVIPNILKRYHQISISLTEWENHPTRSGYLDALTLKTFALDAVVAYMALFLTAYMYVPFGELLMDYFSRTLFGRQVPGRSPEQTGLGPTTPVKQRTGVKTKKLAELLFTYTVVNQISNTFTETILPYLKGYYKEWKKQREEQKEQGQGSAGEKTAVSSSSNVATTTVGQGQQQHQVAGVVLGKPVDGSTVPQQTVIPATTQPQGAATGPTVAITKSETASNQRAKPRHRPYSGRPEEKPFMLKVERELGLSDYSNFVDYAEMVTQFGYINVWSVAWPISPLFSLINNWIELRADAAKISTHVRRPIPERVETIGPWLTTMQFISWLAFITSSTLVYLFRPNLDLPALDQSMNPDTTNLTSSYMTFGSGFLHAAIDDSMWGKHSTTDPNLANKLLPPWIAHSVVARTILPSFIPALLVALLASHVFLFFHFLVRFLCEKFIWEPSHQCKALRMSDEAIKKVFCEGRFDEGMRHLGGSDESHLGTVEKSFDGGQWTNEGGFWRGCEEGDEAIKSVLKTE